ncbi:RNA polymerase II transcription factor B subunit 2 [Galdieria sulphuraria]|nr:RNA polymerase II transcription factor B subunit 2 [Galdieria sulphuraria]
MKATNRGSLLEYLMDSEWADEVETLYKSPYATSCIFEILSSLQKAILTRLLFIQEIDASTLLKWFQKQSQSQIQTIVNHLVDLRILYRKQGSNSVQFQMNPKFQKSLQDLILRNVVSPFVRKEETDIGDHNTTSQQQLSYDVTFLSQYSRHCWNKILQFLVGLEPLESEPSVRIIEALVESGLIEQVEDGFRITTVGFQFLLKDTREQVWFILENILFSNETNLKIGTKLQKRVMNEEMVEFLFELSFCASGVAYHWKTLSKTQQIYIPYLADLGLIYLHISSSLEKDSYFYVTPLGVTLTRSICWLGDKNNYLLLEDWSNVDNDCRMIVQTNFRVYVYTNCTFQISLLSLFIQFLYRLPNMAVGVITRDSIRTALNNGITAQQMISYLQNHMHPNMKGKLPITIIDQIRLWEAQRFRVTTKHALLLDHFDNMTCFEKTCNFAKELGVHLWREKIDDLFETRTFFYLHNFERAKEEALQVQPGPELAQEKQALLARIEIAQGNYDEAIQSLEEDNKDDSKVLKWYAIYLKDASERPNILEQVNDLIESNLSGGNQIVTANILVHEGRYEQALELLQRQPTLETAALEVEILLRMNRLDLAKILTERLNQLEGDAVLTHLTTAWVYLAEGSYREAEYIFAELSERHGSSDMLLNGLATAYIGEGKYQEADNILQELVAKNPNYPPALVNCLVTSCHLSKTKEQMDAYRRQLKRVSPDCKWLKELESFEERLSLLA